MELNYTYNTRLLIKRRLKKDKIYRIILYTCTGIVLLPLILILFQILKNGIFVIKPSFFINTPRAIGEPGGGIANSIIGSIILVTLALLWAIPPSVFTGIFIAEFPGTILSQLVRLSIDVLQGTPSIIIGIFAWTICVVPMKRFSALAGSFALGIMLIPIVVRATEETLKLIPENLREASYALGVPYHKTLLRIVLKTGKNGIINGIVLGITRISGETAPLLFTSFGNPFININILKPVSALPLVIYIFATSPYPEWHRLAWGASLILITFILGLNIILRMKSLQ